MFRTVARWSLVALLVAGCKKEPPKPAPKPDPAPSSAPAPAQPEFKTGPIIDPVNFDSGSASVKESEMPSVDRAVDILKNGNWKVMLVGLADASGDPAANKALTEQRVAAVAQELNKKGIADTRVVQHPIGERLATDTNSSAERKVEFVFYTGGGGMTPREIAIKSHVMDADYHNHQEANH